MVQLHSMVGLKEKNGYRQVHAGWMIADRPCRFDGRFHCIRSSNGTRLDENTKLELLHILMGLPVV